MRAYWARPGLKAGEEFKELNRHDRGRALTQSFEMSIFPQAVKSCPVTCLAQVQQYFLKWHNCFAASTPNLPRAIFLCSSMMIEIVCSRIQHHRRGPGP